MLHAFDAVSGAQSWSQGLRVAARIARTNPRLPDWQSIEWAASRRMMRTKPRRQREGHEGRANEANRAKLEPRERDPIDGDAQ
jgi:hypothetical protein